MSATGGKDVFSTALAGLKSKSEEVRLGAAKSLKVYIEGESRNLNADRFKRFMTDMHRRINELVNSTDVNERMGGVLAIDELIDLKTEENAAKTTRLANHLRMLLPNSDFNTAPLIARALGRLASTGGALINDFVEIEATRALEWLHGEKSESRRYAAVLVLKELAENAPTMFYSHVSAFFETIWITLRDPTIAIRDASAEALRACLCLLRERESSYRAQWYYSMYEQATKGVQQRSPDSIHGGLLTVRELLMNTGDFLGNYFPQLCETVFRFREHKDRIVKKAVMWLIPELARFDAKAFVSGGYFDKAIAHLQATLRRGVPAAYTALGELCLAIGRDPVLPHLDEIFESLRDGLGSQRRPKNVSKTVVAENVFSCLRLLARALGEDAGGRFSGMLEGIFAQGLSPATVETLETLTDVIPELLAPIQGFLLNDISYILCRSPFHAVAQRPLGAYYAERSGGEWRESPYGGPGGGGAGGGEYYLYGADGDRFDDPGVGDPAKKAQENGTLPTEGSMLTIPPHFHALYDDAVNDPSLLSLALRTLATFNTDGYYLTTFVHETVLPYLQSDYPQVRCEAAIACLRRTVSGYGAVRAGRKTKAKAVGVTGSLPQENNMQRTGESLAGEKSTSTSVVGVGGPPTSSSLSRSLTTAATTSTTTTSPSLPLTLSPPSAAPTLNVPLRGRVGQIVAEVVSNVLVVGIADTELQTRETVLRLLVAEARHFDTHLATAENLRLIFTALQDEAFIVRELVMRLLGRLSAQNPAYVLPSLRRYLVQLLTELEFVTDLRMKEESTRILGHLIDAVPRLIRPYVSPILKVLLLRVSDPHPSIVSTSLSTLAALTRVGGTDMREHADRLFPIIIDALQDQGAYEKREAAVSALSQLVESTGIVIEPYRRYAQLLPILLTALRDEDSWTIRREVLKLIGKLGAFDPHELKLLLRSSDGAMKGDEMAGVGVTGAAGVGVGGGGGEKALLETPTNPSSEEYYPSVAINALLRILRDRTLSRFHNMVVQALMFIFKSSGVRSVPFLHYVMPLFLSMMEPDFHKSPDGESTGREFMFQQLAGLIAIVRQHIRHYLPEILDVLRKTWADIGGEYAMPTDATNSLVAQVLNVIEELSQALNEEFKPHLPELLPPMLRIAELAVAAPRHSAPSLSMSLSPADKTRWHAPTFKVLHCLEVIGVQMDDYLHMVVPALVRLFESTEVADPLRLETVRTVGRLADLDALMFAEYTSRLVLPLLRVYDKTPPLRSEIMKTLAAIVRNVRMDFLPFIPIVARAVKAVRVDECEAYQTEINLLVSRDVMGQRHPSSLSLSATTPASGRRPSLPAGDAAALSLSLSTAAANQTSNNAANPPPLGHVAATSASATPIDTTPKKLHVNQGNLKKAWEASKRSTKEDWLEWIRIFSVELLREAPSPALRSCSGLAQVYYPLARELFNAGFGSCWRELFGHYQDEVVRSVEIAFSSPNLPPEVLQTLLNLAEFMEHDDEKLPIDVRALAALAERCKAYAKALHYREMEFQQSPSSTIAHLITINNKLQQHEAAVGILVYAQNKLNVELKESWYEKLERWEDALDAYRRKHVEDPTNLEYLLGRMRCLEALGEWEQLQQLCRQTWPTLESRSAAAHTAHGSSGSLRDVSPSGSPSPSPPPGTLEVSAATATVSATAPVDRYRRAVALRAASAAWNLGNWTDLERYSAALDPRSIDGAFFAAILRLNVDRFGEAAEIIDDARRLLDTEIAALISESYNRAYHLMVRVQQLAELEEIIDYRQAKLRGDIQRTDFIREVWERRLRGAEATVTVWQRMLALRSLVVTPDQCRSSWLKFASLCQKSKKFALSHRTLSRLLTFEPTESSMNRLVTDESLPADAVYGYLKHLWVTGKPQRAYELLEGYLGRQSRSHLHHRRKGDRLGGEKEKDGPGLTIGVAAMPSQLRARCHRKLGLWKCALEDSVYELHSNTSIDPILQTFSSAKDLDPQWYKAWDSWALMNYLVAQYIRSARGDGGSNLPHHRLAIAMAPATPKISRPGTFSLSLATKKMTIDDDEKPQTESDGDREAASGDVDVPGISLSLAASQSAQQDLDEMVDSSDSEREREKEREKSPPRLRTRPMRAVSAIGENVEPYIRHAVEGYFRSVSLDPDEATRLQNLLRILSLWFESGHFSGVERAIRDGFDLVSVDNWLLVIPQLIARIHAPNHVIQALVHHLITKIGKAHPMALIYPLTVSSKSQSQRQKQSGKVLLEQLQYHSPVLVEQAQLVSTELIRCAILWAEMWNEGLEEASRMYFGQHSVQGMFQQLSPLHKMMEKAETLKEISFQQQYGRDLSDALTWCTRYTRSQKESDLNQAWDLYYHVFRRISKQLQQLTHVELQYCSPKLLNAKRLELAVPGTYRAGRDTVCIASFAPVMNVISSKQRPRKLVVNGDDGKEYVFLLKGHEDLRQDERVMQLFGLVNTLLSTDRETARRDLNIEHSDVIPLNSNAGLISWLQDCDTLHSLIKEYRESHKVQLNLEHKMMLQMAPDYDHLTIMQKVEVFEYALNKTHGNDLYKVLWLKSENSEVWLDRRTNYTRSLAVMSMVGYILGLGDRHPSNLMLNRRTGKVVHIDFGDCFEVAMHREKYPEKIPFRLTRMLINAMEVSGIEGNFRFTCESVMSVLRENKYSVLAMLEAFVHDPLINWRLMGANAGAQPAGVSNDSSQKSGSDHGDATSDTQSSDLVASSGAVAEMRAEEGLRSFETNESKEEPQSYSRSVRERELRKTIGPDGDEAPQIELNERGVQVIQRISNKLIGKDFNNANALEVGEQVDRLIKEATSHENLSQCYIGWCPFW